MKKKLVWLLLAALPFTMLSGCGTASEETTSDVSSSQESTGSLAATAVASDSVEYGEVDLCDYKGLSAEKPVTEITQEDIDSETESLLYDYVEYNEVDRPSETGDYVAVSMTAAVNGDTLYDYTDEDGYEIYLGYGEFGEEFDEKLTGVSVGDSLDFDITYDDDFDDSDLAGNTVSYHVEVTGITEEVLPELTDEFITSELGYASADDMNAQITASLQQQNDENSEYSVREDLIQQVIDNSTVTVYSQSLYDSVAAGVEESYSSYAEMFGCESVEEVYDLFGLTEDDIEEEVFNQVYRTIIVHAISEKENISVDDEAYQSGLERYTTELGYDSTDDLLADYDEDSIREWILEDLVLDLIEENADITEVAAESEDEDE